MPKVVEISKDTKALVREINDSIAKEITETQPDSLYLVYVKEGEIFYTVPSGLGVMQALGALDFIKQSIYYDYLEGDE